MVLIGIGDFNLAFLDLIKEVDGLKWSGNCNELNAAYSADGNSSSFRISEINCSRILACY